MSSIILTSGVFDLIHPGHLEHFHEAKMWAAQESNNPIRDWPTSPENNTWLIVLLNSDNSISQLNRKFPPVFNQDERRILLEGVGLVDQVIFFDEATPCKAIKYITQAIRTLDKFESRSPLRKIFYTKGGDYAGQTIPEHHVCEEEEVTLFFTKAKIDSSSNVYNKIKEQLQ